MDKQHYRLGYRPDIEGLRAVAVLLVILCHAGVPGFSGGFIGVDIFFVLSGYLITGLLLREFSSEGTVKFLAFYARRLQRLAPALLTMVLATSTAVYFTISPGGQGVQHLAAVTAALWLSNLHFAFAELDYFAPDAAHNVFLHTWSLSVEEQFYLVWPALIVLVLGRDKGGAMSFIIQRLGPVLLVMLFASFGLCLYLSFTNAVAAYYLPTSRAWQFAAGALALLFSARQRGDLTRISRVPLAGSSARNRACGWMGAGLLAIATWTLTDASRYPGTWALAPTLATAMILVAGARAGSWELSNLLTLRPFVYIGNISYGWYLWHWPVLVLGRLLMPGLSATGTGVGIAISLALAVISYHVVEQPFRRNASLRMNPRVTCVAACGAMAVTVGFLVSLLNVSLAHEFSPELEKYYAARQSAPEIYATGCDEWIHSAEVKKCSFGPANAEHEAILVGDSVAGQWFSAFVAIAGWRDWRLTVLTKSSCPLVDEAYFYPRIGRNFEVCETWRDAALADIAGSEPDLVILSTSRRYPFSPQEWEDGTVRVLDRIAGHVGSIKLLRPTPVLPFDAIDCLLNQAWQMKKLPFALATPCSMDYAEGRRDENVYTALQRAAQAFPNVEAVDLNDLVCPEGACRAALEGSIVFRDEQHVADSFVQQITDRVLERTQLDGLRPSPGANSGAGVKQ